MEENKCNTKSCCCPMKCIWKSPVKGIAIAVGLNFFFFYIWYSQINLVSVAAYLVLFYICYQIVMNQTKEKKEDQDDSKEQISKEKVECFIKTMAKHLSEFREYLDQVSSLSNTSVTIEFFIILYIISLLTSIFSIRFFVWIMVNLSLFYEPLNTRFPEFLFYSYLWVKQIIEGVFGFIECLIPKYEEVVESK